MHSAAHCNLKNGLEKKKSETSDAIQKKKKQNKTKSW